MAAVAPASGAVNGRVNGIDSKSDVGGFKSKNARRRMKKKEQKVLRAASSTPAGQVEVKKEEDDEAALQASADGKANGDNEAPLKVEEYMTDADDPTFKEFANVFARFQPSEQGDLGIGTETDAGPSKGEVIYSDDEDMSGSDSEDGDAKPKMSKKKARKMARLTVAELKQLVTKPEVVEWVDVTANDPRLLVQLKSYRNTIPVPPHWSQKRDYLQGKRGIEKAPFQLPGFIADTGIATMRDALKEKEEGMTLKAKTRERVQPKMGKIDIDYQKLHDAFFRFQTKPKMTDFGEMYYEGKEYETKVKERKPGVLSDELKEALSIPPLAPPPWLISMQRFGPPPSYPNLKIPGLNAPIPEGAQWGYHPGGWGKPPVDEYNRPLYGDVFGLMPQEQDAEHSAPVEREFWGELEPEEEESEEEEEEEEEEGAGEGEMPADGLQTPSGMETPSGTASVTSTVPGGLETPGFFDLRKDARGAGRESTVESTAEGDRQLYHVIPEKETAVRGFMGSERGYDMRAFAQSAGAGGAPPVLGAENRGTKRKSATGVDMAISPEELENMSEEELRERYEASRRTNNNAGVPGAMGGAEREEVSQFAAELASKRRRKEAAERERKGRDKDSFKF